jgi:DNA-binding MarR family transcriptional regulator/GNAT superfamily N-acetyltransferase
MQTLSRVEALAAYRRFNRYYTRRIGVLGEALLQSPYSLAEGRILYELGAAGESGATFFATELQSTLGLDAGYLSRILAGFEKRGLVSRDKAPGDGRRRALSLTPVGLEAFRDLDRRSNADAECCLERLGEGRLEELVDSMRRIESILDGEAPSAPEGREAEGRPAIVLRAPAPGDLGWVITAHAELYSREYGWGPEFETLVARIVADFAAKHDPERERAWIAVKDGARVGSIFLVKVDEATAKLRLLILDPKARGMGLGKRLVSECLAFARSAGYKKVVLWTNSSLSAARGIYAKEGFALVASEPETQFGENTMSETWQLEL